MSMNTFDKVATALTVMCLIGSFICIAFLVALFIHTVVMSDDHTVTPFPSGTFHDTSQNECVIVATYTPYNYPCGKFWCVGLRPIPTCLYVNVIHQEDVENKTF